MPLKSEEEGKKSRKKKSEEEMMIYVLVGFWSRRKSFASHRRSPVVNPKMTFYLLNPKFIAFFKKIQKAMPLSLFLPLTYCTCGIFFFEDPVATN